MIAGLTFVIVWFVIVAAHAVDHQIRQDSLKLKREMERKFFPQHREFIQVTPIYHSIVILRQEYFVSRKMLYDPRYGEKYLFHMREGFKKSGAERMAHEMLQNGMIEFKEEEKFPYDDVREPGTKFSLSLKVAVENKNR